jgi:ATP-dependent Clp protease adapter protein ClpS
MTTARYENGKTKRYQIIVYNSDEMSFTHVIDAFQLVLGYDITQATNCANLIHSRGEYAVKSYSELEHAEAALDMLYDYGLRADVVDKKQK